MTLRFALASSTALAALIAPTFALAEVSAEDVWNNTVAQLKSYGAEVSGDLVTQGNVTTVEGMAATWRFPIIGGAAVVSVDGVELVENGDATVTLRYLSGTQITLAMDVPGQGAGSIGMQLSGDAVEMVAEGAPGDVTYTYDIPSYSITLKDFAVSGPMIEDGDLGFLTSAKVEGVFKIDGNAGRMTVTEGALVKTVIDAGYDSMAYDVSFETDLFTGGEKGGAGATTTSGVVELPAGGVALFAIPDALRQGLSVDFTTVSADNYSDQEFVASGRTVSFSKDKLAELNASVSFDSVGLSIEGGFEGFELETLDPSLPIEIKMALQSGSFDLFAPLMGSPDPQPFTYAFGLEGLTLAESLWQLFDPAGALPRDPATLRLATSGEMGTTMDLLDFAAWMAIDQSDEVPFSIHSAKIGELFVSAVGAELTGDGAFTFDMDDLETFDGVPAPTGEMDFAMKGTDALIDKLVQLGVLQSEDAMGARMGLGLFARPGDAPDTLTSTISIDGASGAISANGQRIR